MSRKYPTINVVETGQNIKQIIKSKGFSVRDVQEYLELTTPQSIYHWFDGRNLPTIDNLYALSGLLGVPVDSLLVGNRSKAEEKQQGVFRRLRLYYEALMRIKSGSGR